MSTLRLFSPVYVLICWTILAIVEADYPNGLFVAAISVAAVLHGYELIRIHVRGIRYHYDERGGR